MVSSVSIVDFYSKVNLPSGQLDGIRIGIHQGLDGLRHRLDAL
jgi:hypothetical protein